MNLVYTRVKFANPHKPTGKRELKKRDKFNRSIGVIKHNHGEGFTYHRVEVKESE